MAQSDRTTGAVSSVAVKAPVKCVTNAAITLAAEQTVNGTAVVTDDRVLVKNQADSADNGIYVVDTGDWVRAQDFDGNEDVVRGTMTFSYAQLKFYYVTSANPIVVGTDDIDFGQAPIDTSGASAYFLSLFSAADAAALRSLIEITRIAFATGAGTVDAITADFTPDIAAWDQTMLMLVEASGANTSTTPTLKPDALAVKTIVKGSNSALEAGDIPGANFLMALRYDTSLDKVQLLNPARGPAAVTASMGASNTFINGTLVHSRAGSAETIAIKTFAGTDPSVTDPVLVVFRNATTGTGDYTVLTISAATSITISSGSTLAAVNSEAFRLWIVGFNDAGTFRLGVMKCATGSNTAGWSIYPLAAWGIASSTAEGGAGAADSAKVFYTGTAVASKPYTVLGYSTWESGLAAVGTWNTAPSRTQLFGPGVDLPGREFNITRDIQSGIQTGIVVVPNTDNVPQNTDGDQYLTEDITPTSAANLVRIDSMIHIASSGNTQKFVSALFRDATAAAIAVGTTGQPTNGNPVQLNVRHDILAAQSTSTTINLRAGGDLAGTTSINGIAAGRKYGGVLYSYIELREVMT